MTRSLLYCVANALLFLCSGCDTPMPAAPANPNQPTDLGAPWVNKTEEDFGSSMRKSDATGMRVVSLEKDDFGGLIEGIAAEYNTPIAVKPKAMLDWHLTVEVQGASADELLSDIAQKCQLTLSKTSDGKPLLTHPQHSTGDEYVVTPEGIDDGATESEE